MERGFRKQEDINCQCQCHFPIEVVCHITHCCHCMGNYGNQIQGTADNNSFRCSENFDSSNVSFKNDKGQNNLMNSYSTNFRSGNDTLNFQNSGNSNFSNSKNYYTMRKLQNQDLRQKLQRNFSDPNFNTNDNNNYSQVNTYSNIIHQEPYKNNNSFNNNFNYNNNNNSNIMNNSINSPNQTNNNYENKNINPNLTYIYKDNLNNKNISSSLNNNNNNQNDNLQRNDLNNINNNRKNPIDINYIMNNNNIDQLKNDLVKAHDIISILQKENEFLKSQRDGAMNKLSAIENMKNIDRVKCDELKNENNELRQRLDEEINKNRMKDNYISNLKDELNDLQNLLHDKDREIQDLILNMRKLEQDANNEINKLKNKIDDLNREKEAIIREFQKEINDLNDELRHLNNLLDDERRKVRELENKIKTMKRFDDKKQQLLENLFNWFNTMNKLLNTNTATGKAPPKELLNDVLNLQTAEEFKDKLNQIEEKLKQFIDDMKLKFGECFACDIACCTSEVDRLKYFRKYYPGPPRDYLEGKKKCKCV